MPASTKLAPGGHRDQPMISISAIKSAPFAISSALRDALNGTLRDTYRPIYFIVRGVASVLKSAGEKQ